MEIREIVPRRPSSELLNPEFVERMCRDLHDKITGIPQYKRRLEKANVPPQTIRKAVSGAINKVYGDNPVGMQILKQTANNLQFFSFGDKLPFKEK